MRWTGWALTIGAAALLALAGYWLLRGDGSTTARSNTPLGQEVYVWQRRWDDSLKSAIREHAAEFGRIVVLHSEVAWQGEKMDVVRVPVDWRTLKATGRPIGLALRIGPYRGDFAAASDRVAALAAEMVAAARRGGVEPAELQIDFDAASSKLDGYRLWVTAVKQRLAPLAVTITTLPTWLTQKNFPALIAAADGYVLQVHSLARPTGINDPIVLCDPVRSRQWVEAAGKLGRPFRVALPTYGHLVAFDATGKFVGAASEGGGGWPQGTQVKTIRSDAAAIAAMVREWRENRPVGMGQVIWYRLPVERDELNWPWATLAAVMRGDAPQGRCEVTVRRTEPGLVEVVWVNDGQQREALTRGVELRWSGARLIAADGLAGYAAEAATDGAIRIKPISGAAELAPKQSRAVAWLRFDHDTEVTTHVLPGDDSAAAE